MVPEHFAVCFIHSFGREAFIAHTLSLDCARQFAGIRSGFLPPRISTSQFVFVLDYGPFLKSKQMLQIGPPRPKLRWKGGGSLFFGVEPTLLLKGWVGFRGPRKSSQAFSKARWARPKNPSRPGPRDSERGPPASGGASSQLRPRAGLRPGRGGGTQPVGFCHSFGRKNRPLSLVFFIALY